MIISAAKAQEAADVLGVELETLTPKALTAAYRSKAKECHPDHHGSEQLQLWARVSWAKEVLEHRLKQDPAPQPKAEIKLEEDDCRACDGTGRVTVGKGAFGKPLTMQCVMCKGEGKITPQEIDFD